MGDNWARLRNKLICGDSFILPDDSIMELSNIEFMTLVEELAKRTKLKFTQDQCRDLLNLLGIEERLC